MKPCYRLFAACFVLLLLAPSALVQTADTIPVLADSTVATKDSLNVLSSKLSAEPAPEGMVLIPGGTFEMGIDWSDIPDLEVLGKQVPHMNPRLARSWFGDETPRHPVTVAPFYMDAREVTNRQYARFVRESGYDAEGKWEKYADPGREDHPVVNVSMNDAKAYAEWAGKRLPTETEWEYAATGGTPGRWYPWGDVPDPTLAMWRHQGETFGSGIVRLLGLRKIDTRQVGSYPPNAFGVYDVVGNASEWTADRYLPYPGFKEFPDGPSPWVIRRRDLRKDDRRRDLRKDERYMERGGSWDDPNPVFVTIRGRKGRRPSDSRWTLGFRCAKSLD